MGGCGPRETRQEVIITMADDNPDYVTLLPTVRPAEKLLVRMRYQSASDDYQIADCRIVARHGAEAEALRWSNKLQLPLRL